MTSSGKDITNEITALPREQSRSNASLVGEKEKDIEIAHVEHGIEEATLGGDDRNPHYTREDAKHSVGLAIIDQVNTIPSAGERKVTHWKEYWSYILFGEFVSGHCRVNVS